MKRNNARERGKVGRTAVVIALSALLHLLVAVLAGAAINAPESEKEFREEVSLMVLPPPQAKEEPPAPQAESLPWPRPQPAPASLTEKKEPEASPHESQAAEPTASAPEATMPSEAPSDGGAAPGSAQDTPLAGSGPESSPGSGPSSSTGSGPAYDSAKQRYGQIVRSRIDRAKRYPAEARQDEGIEGRVKIRLVIAADGSVSSVTVAKSSGSEVLDRAAVEAAERAAPYPPLPEELRPNIVFIVPLDFDLPR